jgi:glycosyltransferase involved in cell wall biosynthesis
VEQTDAPCDEFVKCLSEEERQGFVGVTPYQSVPFEPGTGLFLTFNVRAAGELRTRKQPGDVIATIAGTAQHLISDTHPELRFWEYSIGYRGICAPYRVYQSHVWRHVVHGYTGVDSGRPFDGVVYPWWPVETRPVCYEPDPYVVYCGRFATVKGVPRVCAAAKAAGIKLFLMGFGDTSLITYGENLGETSAEDRDRVLARAQAVLMPTTYLEPFGNIAAEAQLGGTPVIGPDFGAFVETVEQGKTGYRGTTLGDDVDAIRRCKDLDRRYIHQRALTLYSEDAAARSYAAYLTRLELALGEQTQSLISTHTPELAFA